MKAQGWETKIKLYQGEMIVGRGTDHIGSFIDICFKRKHHWRVYDRLSSGGSCTSCNCPAMRYSMTGTSARKDKA